MLPRAMEVGYPGAVAPARQRFVRSLGLRLNVVEWGDETAEPVLLTHGFYDHARSFDTFAPLLARRHRVLALDSRGHGDSEWPDAYTWLADVLDVVNVLRDLGRPAHLVGHSRGGGLATDAALLFPEGVRRLVNIDGFGPPPAGHQAEGMRRFEGTVPELLAAFFDWRRTNVARASFRPSPSLDELAARRRQQNPRLSLDWLRYFAARGAREVEADSQAAPGAARSEGGARAKGWVWKVDPYAARGFGPWRPEWIAPAWRGLAMPMLAVWGDQPDTWGLPDPWRSERLAHVPALETAVVAGAGHFAHIEKPGETAGLVLDWLGRA
jgi:pimeloyl-ACP methyl ester carboxylesterase